MQVATPLLLVTNGGLATASIATNVGPFIHIKHFKIADGYGYEPDRTDFELNGNILFSSQPLTYQNVGDNTIDIVCQIPPDAGPFNFGELGIYIEDTMGEEVLFAKAVWESPQTKYSSLGTNVASSFTFHCLLKLEQSVAVFKIDTLNPVAIWEVDKWSDVVPPELSANPDVPLVLVRELDSFNCSSLLHKSNDLKWTLGTNYKPFFNSTIANASTTWVDLPKTAFRAEDLTTVNRKYVIEFLDTGLFRSVTSFVDQGTYYRVNLNADPLADIPSIGTGVRIHCNENYYDPWYVPISKDAGNLIQMRRDGIYYGVVSPAPFANMFIDAVSGNDAWPGTRAQPLRTLKACLDQGPPGIHRVINLREGQAHGCSPSAPAVVRGGRVSFVPYGPSSDLLPPVYGNSKFASQAAKNFNTRIQAGTFVNMGDAATSGIWQEGVSFLPLDAHVDATAIHFVCGTPNGSGAPISRNSGSFVSFGEAYSYAMQWCTITMPHPTSCFFSTASKPSSFISWGENNLVGPGVLLREPNVSLSMQIYGISPSGQALRPYLPGAGVSEKVIYNLNSNINPDWLDPNPGGGGNQKGGTLEYLGFVESLSGTFRRDGETIYFTEMAGNGNQGGYRNGLAGYINGVQVQRQGHGDTYGTGGGAAIALTGAAGMSWHVAIHTWFPGWYKGYVHRYTPND